MTLSSSDIFRNFSIGAVALLYTLLTFGVVTMPTSAQAKAQSVYYVAELAAPAEDNRVIARGVVWHCAETRCVAAKNNSRDSNVCKRLVREVGALASFTADGTELTAKELAACNR